MHWAYKMAEQLIRNNPNRNTFVCASGISPSGSVHIGNLREIVTTYFVVKALRSLGKSTRFIFSWDDFDRFRKVPKNVDPSFEKYIGMPYSEIPCPYGCHNSYAEHFEREFETSLEAFGMDPEFIYQSHEYKSTRYNHQIQHALKNRKIIYDILMEYKTAIASEEERDSFYPINVYCEVCKKDSTWITSLEEEIGTLTYTCECGHEDTLPVLQATNIKLTWKVDWPMRWLAEEVVFEPGGRDHSSETGSYNVSREISIKIFNNPPPAYEPYEFINIKGSQAKMSSSSGHNLTPGQLIKIYKPENVLFLFAKYQPSASFHMGLDEDVLRNYSEYERFRKNIQSKSLNNDLKVSLELSMVDDEEPNTPNFNQVASLLPLVNFDVELLRDALARIGENYSLEQLVDISNRAEYWIKNWHPPKMIELNKRQDIEFFETQSTLEKDWLMELCNLLRNAEGLSGDELMKKVFAIGHDEDNKTMRNNQKRLFSLVYKLVLNSSNGPRLPLLVEVVGRKQLLGLLDFRT
ncbi:lysine--tRNA ligase [Rossellomorea sp. BNER]|uniref:lysine--tRNA ligase n=1 Tax=Rossellomorea sp. BNER TaxID=2962031 RepID=UPI003AF232D2|nr:lysine--tRNA ligase [Rossellomorea sp. BNER]